MYCISKCHIIPKLTFPHSAISIVFFIYPLCVYEPLIFTSRWDWFPILRTYQTTFSFYLNRFVSDTPHIFCFTLSSLRGDASVLPWKPAIVQRCRTDIGRIRCDPTNYVTNVLFHPSADIFENL
ncbi:hypothetical protein K438DRAFT_2021504 [Mycena galopus ATCC 62051]|nr:hypothetical protein K438DRAFT_2021504 [Mycena galopus ATCC 62051]